MDEHAEVAEFEEQHTFEPSAASAIDEQASEPFVGQWQRLVSQTNWEKGRIINEWRTALAETGAAGATYSDEAWSRMVGGVTPQHVGRLRRVAQRFGGSFHQYPGVYWSHFFAALEWDDAEMWLEGAVQNRWSVSAMRRTRAETLGEVAEESQFEQPAVMEPDEDFEPLVGVAETELDEVAQAPEQLREETVERSGGEPELEAYDPADMLDDTPAPGPAPVRPFADLPDLPDDLAEAFDAFKLAILAHKTQQWRDVPCADVLASLDALKSLATAP